MRTTLILACLFILVLVGGYFVHKNSVSVPVTAPTTTQTATVTQTQAQERPSSVTASTPALRTYTMAQVAAHKSSVSCWAVINGNVYDLTSWISQHPGGPERILSICGKDGTSAFSGQHGGDPRVASILATFKIGTLAS